MGSRVYTVGNIVSRAKDLFKSGVLKTPPVWLEAVEQYPPLTPMAVNAGCVRGKPPRVNYRKDLLMKDFFERYRRTEEIVSLFEDHSQQTIAEKFVEYQMSLIGDQWITKELKETTTLEAKDYIKSHYGIQLMTKNELSPEEREEEEFNDGLILAPVDKEMEGIWDELLTNVATVSKERVLTNKKSNTLHNLLRSFSNEV